MTSNASQGDDSASGAIPTPAADGNPSAEIYERISEIDRRLSEFQAELSETEEREGHLLGAINVTRAERKRLERTLALDSSTPPAQSAVTVDSGSAEENIAGKRTAIEVSGLSKAFRLPLHKPETLKEQVLHPLRSQRYEPLQALDGVSFDVAAGEFLGVAGPNGSGKSTLLRVLASIYAADSGSVRTLGEVAPFIELGAGLNPELTAYDNVVISGVLMGLEPNEARARYEHVIAFAGLEEFTEMKLKNYSSGMTVRLAFSVMVQVDAQILLVDEVLAVGDAEFRAKCLARLEDLRSAGATIVLVSHAMDALVEHCDRAILLEHGRIVLDGDPAEIAVRYNGVAPGPEPPGA
jgi:ABC-type polysaccharide/polyol phosphate transport system ATPase subunit